MWTLELRGATSVTGLSGVPVFFIFLLAFCSLVLNYIIRFLTLEL